jgi:pimeloyl-ACP methyl ester carboxylesterase
MSFPKLKIAFASLFYFGFCLCLFSQAEKPNQKMKIYLIPGQGSDSRLFNNLKLDTTCELIKVNYIVPEKHTNMKEYAALIGNQVDTSEKFIIVGVSLGGMICTELADMLHPEAVIIVSSAKCRSELPFRYRFLKYVPINKLIPARFYWLGAQIAQPIVEPDRKNGKEVFKSMLKDKNPRFLKRTTDMIVHWDRISFSDKIVHIHGNSDHTIPIRNVKADFVIENGSHMMMYTKAGEIGKLINEILNDK